MASYIPQYSYGPSILTKSQLNTPFRWLRRMEATAKALGEADKTKLFDEPVVIKSVVLDEANERYVTNFDHPYKGTPMTGEVPFRWLVNPPAHLADTVAQFETELDEEEAASA